MKQEKQFIIFNQNIDLFSFIFHYIANNNNN